ncbi:RNA polymerase factor sigma-70 [Marinomonas communis]|jgi:RNA polymerase sigma-70 factor (ECF subfamily)|uniref:RNA polymerase sigma-70 factor (ECF subfamily) n=1 Tax=Marinomonas communis TaxID=28254 RepID=A0A4R6WYQ2_9GAMM|nr:RNA polymerase factor sigma-70 [Marinomonas communis]TDR06305.1 RNA polymerase sigma-70 factor (ECF subfamily) [Marinomonas communis]
MTQALSRSNEQASSQLFQDTEFMEALRSQMLKFAILQVRNEALAEDAVQEAMLSAYQNIERFNRQAALKTWVFAILKNKLIDILRKEKRYTNVSLLEEGAGRSDEALLEDLFNEKGHWQKSERPKKWDEPDHDIENSHFWRTFDVCLEALPAKHSRYFMMREFLELETKEICENEEVSVSNLNTTLFRARLRLRECLEDNWFIGENTP